MNKPTYHPDWKPWKFRTGEVCLAHFHQFNGEAKELHILYLKTLKPEELGDNDLSILRIYDNPDINLNASRTENFFSL